MGNHVRPKPGRCRWSKISHAESAEETPFDPMRDLVESCRDFIQAHALREANMYVSLRVDSSLRLSVAPRCFRWGDGRGAGGIADFDEIEAFGGCGRAAGAAVAGGKGASDVVGMPAPEPDEL